MLNDSVRTLGFLDAVAEVVRPGDVVVDVGTGTGILAAAAVRAGASRVYAIEAGAIARSARRFFEVNGLADRITLIENWSTHVSLPERADVLVSEIIGDDPLEESVLEFMADACSRFLRAGGRTVPSGLRLFGIPVSLPEDVRQRVTFTREATTHWKALYGFEFSSLERDDPDAQANAFVRRGLSRALTQCTEPLEFAVVDLSANRQLNVKQRVECDVVHAGAVDGVLIYCELTLSPTKTLSTDPRLEDLTRHWRDLVWLLPRSIDVRKGDRLQVVFEYDGVVRGVKASVLTPL